MTTYFTNQALTSFLILIVFTLILNYAGISILRLLKFKTSNKYYSFFLGSFIILIILVSTFALIETKLKTLFLFSIPLISILTFRLYKTEISKQHGNNLNYFLFLIITLTLNFLLQFLTFWDFKNSMFLPPLPDDFFYANLSCYITDTGNESINFNFYNILSNSPQPYHYFEIWLNGLFYKITSNGIISLELITIPLLREIALIGIVGLVQSFIRQNNLAYIIGICLLFFFAPVFLDFYGEIDFLIGSKIFTINNLIYPKLCTIYLFLIAFLIFYLDNKYEIALIILLILSLVFITTLPAIYLSIFFLIIYYYFVKIRLSKSFYILYFITPILTITFYFINGKYNKIHTLEYNQIYRLDIMLYIKTFVNIIGGTMIRLSVIYLFPIIILSILFIIKWKSFSINEINKHQHYILTFLFFTIGSILAWAILNPLTDAVQFFTNFGITFINLCFILILGNLLITNAPFILRISIILLISFNIYQFTSATLNTKATLDLSGKKFWNELYNRKEILNQAGAFCIDSTESKTIFTINPIFNIPCREIDVITGKRIFASLSVLDTPIINDAPNAYSIRNMLSSTSFYQFAVNNGYPENQNINQLKNSFIHDHHIKYIAFSANASYHFLDADQIREIITNQSNGQKIIFLK